MSRYNREKYRIRNVCPIPGCRAKAQKKLSNHMLIIFWLQGRGRWCPLIGTPSPIDKIKPFYFAARGTSCQAHNSLALGVMNNWGMLSSPAASFIYYTHVGGKQLGKNTCSSIVIIQNMFHAHIAYENSHQGQSYLKQHLHVSAQINWASCQQQC